MKIKGKIFPFIAGLIFFAVGMLLTVMACRTFFSFSGYGKAEATVISAEVYYDDGKLMAVSTYEYYVDGVRYEHKLGAETASSAKLEGETFTVRYDLNNPAKVVDREYMILIVLGFGLVFAAAGGGIIVALFMGKIK